MNNKRNVLLKEIIDFAQEFRPPENVNLFGIDLLATPLGDMVAVADNNFLYYLQFIDKYGLLTEIIELQLMTKARIENTITPPLQSIRDELNAYFDGKLTQFATPLKLIGTEFQNTVWQNLTKVAYGQIHTYKDIAQSIGKINAYRAVANANSTNQILIVIPCHRIIKSDGQLCGYSNGVDRKKWLIGHEAKNSKAC